MYKVFINNKAIHLMDTLPINQLQNYDLFFRYHQNSDLNQLYNSFMQSKGAENMYIIAPGNLSSLWHNFKALFTEITAAGGVVTNTTNQLLVINRRGKWDLPKGKVEENETCAEAAKREVEEETGIGSLMIINSLPLTYHIYFADGTRLLKTTWWYRMKTSSTQQAMPQTEEEISEARWINPDQVHEACKNTFRSLITLFHHYLSESK